MPVQFWFPTPVLIYDVRSRGAESYIRLAKEIISRNLPAQDETPEIEIVSQPVAVNEDHPEPAEPQVTQPDSSLTVVSDSSPEEPAAPNNQKELDKTA